MDGWIGAETGGPNREEKGIGEGRREYGGTAKTRGHLKGHLKKRAQQILESVLVLGLLIIT